MILLEKSALLRTLNYLRISHGFALRYNWIYPALLSVATVSSIYFGNLSEKMFEDGGIVAKFSPYFSLTTPFFLAALSAVATFTGPPGFDGKFKMVAPVTLRITDRGETRTHDVSPRYFLSLLFGYCCVMSFLLFIVSTFVPYFGVAKMAPFDGTKGNIWTAFALAYFFLFYQISILMLLGIYYLADKFHRR